jgi:hypothetical protein
MFKISSIDYLAVNVLRAQESANTFLFFSYFSYFRFFFLSCFIHNSDSSRSTVRVASSL